MRDFFDKDKMDQLNREFEEEKYIYGPFEKTHMGRIWEKVWLDIDLESKQKSIENETTDETKD